MMKDKLSQILGDRADKYPYELERQYPRVLAKICKLWGTPAMHGYFRELLVDTRGNRRGFPPEVAAEILRLSALEDELRLCNQGQSVNSWSHVEAPKNAATDRTPGKLLKAAETGDAFTVFHLLDSGIGIDVRDESGSTPLLAALYHRHEALALRLIARGASVHAKDPSGSSSLHWAAFHGHQEAVRQLIAKGADIDAQDKAGCTPLLRAVMHGHTVIIQLLLIHGGAVNLCDRMGSTPLHKAILNGSSEIVEMLLARGADPNARDPNGDRPLRMAFRRRYKEIGQLLVNKGADPI
jgi:uncharacterized protein